MEISIKRCINFFFQKLKINKYINKIKIGVKKLCYIVFPSSNYSIYLKFSIKNLTHVSRVSTYGR